MSLFSFAFKLKRFTDVAKSWSFLSKCFSTSSYTSAHFKVEIAFIWFSNYYCLLITAVTVVTQNGTCAPATLRIKQFFLRRMLPVFSFGRNTTLILMSSLISIFFFNFNFFIFLIFLIFYLFIDLFIFIYYKDFFILSLSVIRKPRDRTNPSESWQNDDSQGLRLLA